MYIYIQNSSGNHTYMCDYQRNSVFYITYIDIKIFLYIFYILYNIYNIYILYIDKL